MPLPVSAEQHHYPPQQYPTTQPPHLPNVAVLPEARALMVHAASMVANSAGYYSNQSNARMFCYNLLSSHGWNNTAFAEVVKLACDSAVLKARMGEANTPGSALDDAVAEALALYTSTLVISYPELGRMMSNDHVAAAASNAAIYQDLLAAIDGMYAQDAQGFGQPRGAHVGFQGRGTVPLQHGAMGGVNRHTQPAVHAATHKSASAAYIGSSQRQQQQEAPVGRFGASRVIQNRQEAKKEDPVVEKKAEPTAIIGEIESMDRNAHRIAYFGKDYEIPTSPLRRAFEEATERHESVASSDTEVESEFVCKSMDVEASLDELISVTRAKRCANNTDLNVYLCAGMVVTPIISAIPVDDVFKKLSEAKTFSQIARILGDHMDSVKDKATLRHTAAYVAQIDRVLTAILNDFLGNMLSVTGVSVGSFIEDAPSVTEYLNKRFVGEFNSAYINYQRYIVEHLFQHTRAAAAEDDLVAMVTDYDANAFWDNMVVAYSITYINATSQELGYTIGKTAKEITEASSPMFSRLITAAQKTYEKGVMLSHHLIVTSDDARYRLYNRAGASSTYIIKEA